MAKNVSIDNNQVMVSVIIPIYNRQADLFFCLQSIFSQNYPFYEVIVVDDCSTDCTEDMVRTKFPDTIFLRTSKRSGVSVTKNLAVKRANGKYIWFLDSDSIVENTSCMRIMVDIMEQDPSIGTLGGEVIVHGKTRYCRRVKFLFFEDTCREDQFIARKLIWKCDYLPTCNCFVRHSILPEFEIFSKDILYGYEDAQLGRLVANQGYQNIMRYDTLVFHVRSNVSRIASYENMLNLKALFIIQHFGILVFIISPILEIYTLFRATLAARNMSSKDVRSDPDNCNFLQLGRKYVTSFIKAYFSTLYKVITEPSEIFDKEVSKGNHRGMNNGQQ